MFFSSLCSSSSAGFPQDVKPLASLTLARLKDKVLSLKQDVLLNEMVATVFEVSSTCSFPCGFFFLLVNNFRNA